MVLHDSKLQKAKEEQEEWRSCRCGEWSSMTQKGKVSPDSKRSANQVLVRSADGSISRRARGGEL